jgi:hypothetical protein
VRAYSPYGGAIWEAAFDDHTPAELIAAFLTRLVDPAGITRTREEVDWYAERHAWTRELPANPT